MYHLVGMRNKLFAIMLSIMMIMMFVRYLSQERNELEFSTFAYDHDDHFMMVKMIIVKIMMTTMMMLMALIMQFTTVLTR